MSAADARNLGDGSDYPILLNADVIVARERQWDPVVQEHGRDPDSVDVGGAGEDFDP